MDSAYFTWLWLLAGGMVVGLFIRARTVVIVAAICMAVAVGGLVISSFLAAGNATMLFGFTAMGIPWLGGMAAAGAWLGNVVRCAFATHSSQRDGNRVPPEA